MNAYLSQPRTRLAHSRISYIKKEITYSRLGPHQYKINCNTCQLHLTVTSKEAVEVANKEHAYLSCTKIDPAQRPSEQQRIHNKCFLCNGKNKPIFVTEADLKLHMIYAHSNLFFSLKVPNYQEPYQCPYCPDSVKILRTWRETLVHLGIEHEKLYQVLKYHQTQDLNNLLKRLYPAKHGRFIEREKLRNMHN